MTLDHRLSQARERLAGALRSGADTSPHRAALVQLEGDLQRQTDEATATRADECRQRIADISARALALTAEAQDTIAKELEQLDLDITQ